MDVSVTDDGLRVVGLARTPEGFVRRVTACAVCGARFIARARAVTCSARCRQRRRRARMRAEERREGDSNANKGAA